MTVGDDLRASRAFAAKIDRRAGACLPPHGEAIHPQTSVTLSGAERSRMGLAASEKQGGGSLTFPFGEGAEQREADEVLFKKLRYAF